MDILAREIKEKKEYKHPDWKGRNKTLSFEYDTIIYIENLKNTQGINSANIQVQQGCRIYDQYTKICCIYSKHDEDW